MELNKFEKVMGVIPVADVVEGRFVLLTSHSFDNDFGSDTDLPGAKVPATAEEAKRARYCLTWAVDNRKAPIIGYPSMEYAMRGGFSESANAPFSATVYLTPPGNQNGVTIPSGTKSLAFADGTFTIPSGGYIYNSNIVNPGASLIVANTADDGASDAGKLKYTATEAVGVLFETVAYDSTDGKLTVRSK